MQLQQAQLQKRIKVWEAVDLWASLYKKKPTDAERLLDQLGLADKREAWFMNLSGGQKQRLFIALALINDPEVVFLDELTTGLDPQARRAIWDLVRGIRERGKTVFLTTHLMEEAERLCDRVAIIERGRIIDIDTPQRLVDRHCPERTVVLATDDLTAEERFRAIPRIESVVRSDMQFTIRGRGDDLVTEVIHCLSENQMRVTDFRMIVPNLEDVFLKLTGHSIRELGGNNGAWTLETNLDRDQSLHARAAWRVRDHRFPRHCVPRDRPSGRPQYPAPRLATSGFLRIGLPVLAALLIAVSSVISLVTIVSIYREGGILKRLRATPLRPQTILTAHVIVKLALTAATLALDGTCRQTVLPDRHSCSVVRFYDCAANQHFEYPVDRISHRQHRSHGPICAAHRRSYFVSHDRYLGTLHAA